MFRVESLRQRKLFAVVDVSSFPIVFTLECLRVSSLPDNMDLENKNFVNHFETPLLSQLITDSSWSRHNLNESTFKIVQWLGINIMPVYICVYLFSMN